MVKGNAVTVLVGLERDEFGQLAAQHFRWATEVMHHDLGCLLLFGEVTTLVEPVGPLGIHEEIGWSRELDDQAAGFSGRCLADRPCHRHCPA